MKRRKNRKRKYTFTEKTQSKRAITALALGVLSLTIFVIVIVNSFRSGGNGSMYLGSAGVTSMLLAITAFVLAVRSLFEQETFKFIPYLSVVISFCATGIWVCLYIAGFLFA